MQYHKLNHNSSSSSLQEILNISNEIFQADSTNPTPYSSITEWRTRISNEHSIVIYVTLSSKPTAPLGFIFAYPKTYPEIGRQTFHIWLAGTLPNSRGLGVFSRLMDEVSKHAQQAGYDMLSVTTIPRNFETMYALLRKGGWEENSWKGDKVLMTKTVSK